MQAKFRININNSKKKSKGNGMLHLHSPDWNQCPPFKKKNSTISAGSACR